MYKITFTKQAEKDVRLIEQAGLKSKAALLLRIVSDNPYQNPPPYKRLKGKLSAFYSRKINAQHRLVYLVNEEQKSVRVAAMWTHYENLSD